MTIESGYSSANEIEFIDGLGTYARLGMSRGELLRRYISAAAARVDWDGIDGGVVTEYAIRLLSQLEIQ